MNVVMGTANCELSFVLNGVNLGVAYDGIPLDKPLVPCVVLEHNTPEIKEAKSEIRVHGEFMCSSSSPSKWHQLFSWKSNPCCVIFMCVLPKKELSVFQFVRLLIGYFHLTRAGQV